MEVIDKEPIGGITASRDGAHKPVAKTICGLLACGLAVLLPFFPHAVAPLIFLVALIRMALDNFDYRSPTVVFIAPWFVLYGFTSLPITSHSRDFSELTLEMMLAPVLITIIASIPLKRAVIARSSDRRDPISIDVLAARYNVAIIILFILFLANVAYSGFSPLINLMRGDGSDYLDYGIKGVNGLFYAYSNSLAMLSYYCFLHTRKRKYLIIIWFVFAMFILCLTRQNLVSLAVELLVLHAFVRQPIRKTKLAMGIVGAVVAFGFIGDIRSGDIRELMGLLPSFDSLPTAFIWLYAYGFFNVLNLDNVVVSHEYGFLDGSSIASLIPSVFRPDGVDHSDLVEVSNFTISSYILPLLIDLGPAGVFFFTAAIIATTYWAYRRALAKRDFKSICIYCVLYFCGLFSFFVNFWLYLPIIFQIPFVVIFSRILMSKKVLEHRQYVDIPVRLNGWNVDA